MPLPLILVGAAVVAGGYGAKKAFDATSDYNEANRIKSDTTTSLKGAENALKRSRNQAVQAFEDLGSLKLSVYENSLTPFIHNFNKIKAIQHDELANYAPNLEIVSAGEYSQLEIFTLEAQDVIKGGIAALGSGGLVGLAAYGGVGFLGSASTGAAISGLSGVAATNATLAWFGFGSIASGGLGVAGGTAILGGIVAGPVLAVGGMMAAAKAAEAAENARANHKKAQLAISEMNLARTTSDGIRKRTEQIRDVLNELNDAFQPLLAGLTTLVEKEGPRQAKQRQSKVSSILIDLAKQETTLDFYLNSRKGFWNKVRYFFLSNPYEARFLAQSKTVFSRCANELSDEEISIREPTKKLSEKAAKSLFFSYKNELESVSARISEDKIVYDLMSDADKKGVFMALSIAKVIKDICATPIINEDGILSSKSRSIVDQARSELTALTK
ncbi:hypothetical protein [Alcanivorax quisquiliarum]|uniref:Uncharacterized protein n=1 Tax=Alcanivorax quisquiliarum TaxID=2933565 RepID=A0ABT0EA00_9GAMM|nr:hypothetical protein [Alcanivorax quisquiliarum]MCK0538658.1 hypothetical protein [Alcanivorax quisquiliarum]